MNASFGWILSNYWGIMNNTMRKKVFLVSGACVLFVMSMNSCTDKLDVALDFADANRQQLETVIDHYKSFGDEEKLHAAEFLIANMPGHKSMTGAYAEYYDAVDSLFSCGLSKDEAYEKLPHLSAEFEGRISYEFDSRVMSADYLIRDIDRAFAQWREGEWAKHLDFDEFCEWLLPYTCGQTCPLDDWREELEPVAGSYIAELKACIDYKDDPRSAICCVNDALKAMIGKQKISHDDNFIRIYRPSTFANLPSATCLDYCKVATRVLKSKGIPVTIDFTPQWSNRLYGHYWAVFPTLKGKTSMFGPYSSNPDYPHNPHGRYPKVFRRTYSPNDEYLSLLKRTGGDMPGIVGDVFFKDVTDEYHQTVDLEVKLTESVGPGRKDVYIAVFDCFQWLPVFWGKARFAKAEFKEMGRDVTYMVLGYEDGKSKPLSLPFYVDFEGRINYMVPDYEKVSDIRMYRKYPLFSYVFKRHKFMKGGYVEASATPDFKDAETVAVLPRWSLTSGREQVIQKVPLRYWRFCADDGKVSDMAEMYFRDEDGNWVKPVNMSPLTDGDPLTNHSAKGDEVTDFLDMGKPVMIDEILYIRRGDGNPILPGDEYEVYYWDDSRWNLHSHVVADDIFIDVKGLPSGALYYIKGLSRGVQTRIFTWDETASEVVWR